jgi:hypothetical protein
MNLDNRIEFVAADEREATIPYVRLTDRQGQIRDDSLKATDGKVISQDCELCHTLPE